MIIFEFGCYFSIVTFISGDYLWVDMKTVNHHFSDFKRRPLMGKIESAVRALVNERVPSKLHVLLEQHGMVPQAPSSGDGDSYVYSPISYADLGSISPEFYNLIQFFHKDGSKLVTSSGVVDGWIYARHERAATLFVPVGAIGGLTSKDEGQASLIRGLRGLYKGGWELDYSY